MKVRFEDERLRRLYEDTAFRMPKLGNDVVRAYRKKVGFIAQAHDERDLRRYKALRLEKLRGDRDGQHSIRLNDQWRLVLRFEPGDDGRTVVVVEIVDYH